MSEGARAIARTVLPPWRTPLLLCLLGTLLLVLEMGQAEPERLQQIIVDEAPLDVLAVHDLSRLQTSLAGDGLHLDASVEQAITDDREAAERDPDGVVANLQKRAMADLSGRAVSLKQRLRSRTRKNLNEASSRRNLTSRRGLGGTSSSSSLPQKLPTVRRGFTFKQPATKKPENNLFARLPNVTTFVERMRAEQLQLEQQIETVSMSCCSPRLRPRGAASGEEAAGVLKATSHVRSGSLVAGSL